MGQVQAEATPQAQGHIGGLLADTTQVPGVTVSLTPIVRSDCPESCHLHTSFLCCLGPQCWGHLGQSLCRHTAAPGMGWPVLAQAQTPEVPSPGHHPWGLSF